MATQSIAPNPYDKEDESGYGHPDLGPGHDGAVGNPTDPRGHDVATGDSSDPRGEGSDSLGSQEESVGAPGLYNAGGDKGLAAAEAGAGGSAAGSTSGVSRLGAGFNPVDNLSPLGRARALLGKNKRKAAVGGIVTGGVGTLIIAGFLALIPLKIENVVSNLHNRFFATSNQALENQTDNMFEKYVKNHVLKDYKRCGTTVSKKCTVNIISRSSGNPITNLYKSWSQARLENKLATNYGIEFKFDKASNQWYLKSPGTRNGGDPIGSNGQGLDREFKRADRGAMRAAVSNAMQGETWWKKLAVRYPARRLLDEKYGLKNCIFFCGKQDTFADKAAAKKTAAQVFLVQRVITPRTETMGIVMECLLDPSCDPEKSQPSAAEDGTSGELSGAPESDTDSTVRTHLQSLAATYGITDSATVDKMISDYKGIQDDGYAKYLTKAIFEKFGLKELGSNIADTAPLIGWINAASKIVGGLATAGPKIKKLAYVTNATAAVSLFTMYQTYADEIHTGHVDPTELGSMVKSLGPGNSGASTDPEVGGTATAESTPLYQNLMGSGSTATTATLLSSLLPSASAAPSQETSNTYKCKDNKSIRDLLCPEEKLGGGNALANSVSNTLNSPPFAAITGIAKAWNSVPGKILGFFGSLFGSALSAIPGVNGLISDASSFVANLAKPFMDFAVNKIVPNPFGSNMSGGRTFDMMAAGADVSGNDFAHTGLGGKAVSASTAATVAMNQDNEAQQQFSQQSLFARMFSTDSQYSLASKVAMDLPFGAQSASENSFASLLSNPFGALSHSFASIFSSKALAAGPTGVVGGKDPFGVTQYMPTPVDDAETYWDQHCSDNAAQGYQNDADYNNPATSYNQQAAATEDPTTGMPENKSSNPCLLIKRSVGVAGGKYDSNSLTKDDLADLNGGISTPKPSVSGGYFHVIGNRINDATGKEFIPYGTSVVDDLDQLDWQAPNTQAVSTAQIAGAAQYWHVNTIRLQVSELNIMGNPSPGKTYNLAAMQRLGTEVDQIESLGKIPIINDNVEQTSSPWPPPTTRTEDFWKAVTDYFSGINSTKYSNVIFDLFNEPTTHSWSTWQKGGGGAVGMQDIVTAIRKEPNDLGKTNLILVEGPSIASTLSQLDKFPITGSTIAFAYHHVDFTSKQSDWETDAGLNLTVKVPIIDGEWAQYSANRAECFNNAPKYVDNYLSVLKANHVGLIFWTLEPSVGLKLDDPNKLASQIGVGNFYLDDVNYLFSTSPAAYSSPNSFSGNYTCSNSPKDLGQGAGSKIMDYFAKNSGSN